MKFWLAIAVLLLATPLMAHADLPPLARCESLTDAQRLARADLAGLGEITKTSCTCARRPYCTYTVALTQMKKGEPQKLTYTETTRLNFYQPIECTALQKQAALRLGAFEYFYFRKTETGYLALNRRNCTP